MLLDCLESRICERGPAVHQWQALQGPTLKYRKLFCCPQENSEPYGQSNRIIQTAMLSSENPVEGTAPLWRCMVRDFALRRLTFDSDKLPAIAGIATAMQRKAQWQHLAGLWKEALLGDMCWHVWFGGLGRHKPSSFRQRPSPSWPWLSYDGDGFICWPEALLESPAKHQVDHVRVLDVNYTPTDLSQWAVFATASLT